MEKRLLRKIIEVMNSTILCLKLQVKQQEDTINMLIKKLEVLEYGKRK